MRLFGVVVLCFLVASGCARNKSATPATTKSVGPNPSLLVTPGAQLAGRVSLVNPTSRYIIATFPVGRLPMQNQRFNVYREGLKVGTVKVSGWQRDVNVAADIVEGECRVGDEIKAEQ